MAVLKGEIFLIKATAPGKLYIAGEYAVLEPGHPALIVALDQFITVTLKEANEQGSICSSYSNGISIPWTRKNGKFYIDERENPFSYITKSVTIVEQYLKELDYELKYFDLTIAVIIAFNVATMSLEFYSMPSVRENKNWFIIIVYTSGKTFLFLGLGEDS